MKLCTFSVGKSIRILIRNVYSPVVQNTRSYPALPKRFYYNVDVISNDNNTYEIVLDSKKLKTPLGNTLQIGNKSLALAVASEWHSQKETVQRSSMHLTGLCNTVQDKPNHADENSLIRTLLNYLYTDAVLYHCEEIDELCKLQARKWCPIIDWFNNKYGVNVCPVNNISFSFNNQAVEDILQRHLKSYSYPCLQGFAFATENLKSLILTMCCVEQEISVEEAVLLSRVEEEYQIEKWGRVEWAHDLHLSDLQARVSAAVLFVRLNLESSKVQSKE